MVINWSRGRDPKGAGAINEAEEAAGLERLSRLRGRTLHAEGEETKAPLAPLNTASDVAECKLATNAFAILGIHLTASATEIGEAYEHLSFEPGHDPAALSAARAALQSPSDRLEAEIGWLPGLPLRSAKAVLAALRTNDLPSLASVREKATSVARVNLTFALVECNPGELSLASQLLDDAQSVDSDVVLDQLDDARFHAKFREIDRETFDRFMDEHARAIAARLALIFSASAAARNVFTRALQDLPSNGRFGACFRDELMRAYGAAIHGPLEEARQRVLTAIEELRAQPGNEAQAATLITSLDNWSGLRRPRQVHEAARGLDDPASADICNAVRSLAVDLSNEHEQFEIALRLARALLVCFRLVPARHAALERELPVLIGNALIRRGKQLAVWALAQPTVLSRAIEAGALDGTSGTAGSIAGLIAEVDEHPDDQVRTAVFLIVRDIGIQLHNDRREVKAAYILTAWLAECGPPPEVAVRLQEDLKHFGVKATVTARANAAVEPNEAGSEERTARTGFGRARRDSLENAADPFSSPSAPPRTRNACNQDHNKVKPPRLPASVRGHRRRASTIDYILVALLVIFWLSAKIGNHRSAEPASAPRRMPTSGYSRDSRFEGAALQAYDAESRLRSEEERSR